MPHPRVLVIDDDAGVRSTICSMLQSSGYEAVEAVNGVDGIDVLRAGGVDLVITDVIMTVQEGIETIRQIRRMDARLPIIAMSGWHSDEVAFLERAIATGANRTLEKPFRIESLLRAVADLLPNPPEGSRPTR